MVIAVAAEATNSTTINNNKKLIAFNENVGAVTKAFITLVSPLSSQHCVSVLRLGNINFSARLPGKGLETFS